MGLHQTALMPGAAVECPDLQLPLLTAWVEASQRRCLQLLLKLLTHLLQAADLSCWGLNWACWESAALVLVILALISQLDHATLLQLKQLQLLS